MRKGLLSFALVLSCIATATAQSPIHVEGTTNLTPLLAKAATAYQASHVDAQIEVKGTSSGAGIAALKSGTIDVAASDVTVNDDSLTGTTLGVVGFAFVANTDARVKNLTRQQLIGIFAGKIKNWKAVGGSDEAISIISRDIGTGTRLVLEQKVAKTLIDTRVVGNANEVIEAVQSTPGALGYVATYFVGSHTDLVVSYNGVTPTPETIRDHTYGFSTDEHLYVKANGSDTAKAFVAYVAADTALLQWYGIYH
jgi:phosphate transport system substrate-binding protein